MGKIRRYSNLVREIANWPEFLLFKTFKSNGSFTFRLRNSFEIAVDLKMLPPFKEIFFDKVYLNEITQKYMTSQSPVIVDIGANVGFFSLFMLSRFPEARVIAFEPMPFNFKVLEEYKRRYPQFDLTAVNMAVYDKEGSIVLNASSLDSFTTMSSVMAGGKRTETIEVKAAAFSSIFADYKLSSIDFLKLDCEGSEYAILYSALEDLLERVKIMGIETHPGAKKNENLDSLSHFLTQRGFVQKISRKGDNGYIWAWRE